MTTLLLSDRDVRALLPVAACIDVMADALRCVAQGDAVLPLRSVLRIGESRNAFASMPAILGSGDNCSIGAKLITVFPGNDATPFDSHIGVVLLFDAVHGTLLAIADASSVTAIRTAAVSGLATRMLANEDASELAILGAGVLAMPHLEAIRAVRPIRTVRVWSHSGTAVGSRVHGFAERVRAMHDVSVRVCDSVQEAVDGADVVCTITSSRTPILEGRWLSPGAHVNAVGASLPTARELDSDAVRRSLFFADRRESVLAEAGDYLIPLAAGAIGPAHLLGELGELVLGTIAGRRSATDVTLFKSLGLAVEDVAAVRYVYAKAVATGRGTAFDLGGRRE